MDLELIAEGVETSEQAAFLREHGCDSLQGFLVSPPLPPDACTAWLRQQMARDDALFWTQVMK